MVPILYEENETAFTSWGLGLITDAKSAVVTEELNGDFTAVIEIPYTSLVYPMLSVDRIILLKTPDSTYPAVGGKEPFRIRTISKPINGIVKVDCEHVSGQLKKVIVRRHVTPGRWRSFIVGDVGSFTFSTSALDGDTIPAVKTPMTLREYLQGKEGSITDATHCDWRFTRWNVIALKPRGRDRGFTVRYGKDLTDIKQEENIANVWTSIYPYWMKEENGTITYVAPTDAIDCQYAQNYTYRRIQLMDCSGNWDQAPTVQQLQDYAASYMDQNGYGIPQVSITVQISPIAGAIGYGIAGRQYDPVTHHMSTATQEVYLGDSVKVVFERLGIDVKTRVNKYTYDSISERYKSIELGTVKPRLHKTLAATIKKTGVPLQ